MQETLRLKFGVTQQRWLGYLTGGLAITDIKYKSSYNDDNAQAGSGLPGAKGSNSATRIQFGWTLGGGVEYAFTDAWSIKAEYQYANFGNVQMNYPIIPTPTLSEFSASFNSKADLTIQNLLLGLTYCFA